MRFAPTLYHYLPTGLSSVACALWICLFHEGFWSSAGLLIFTAAVQGLALAIAAYLRPRPVDPPLDPLPSVDPIATRKRMIALYWVYMKTSVGDRIYK